MLVKISPIPQAIPGRRPAIADPERIALWNGTSRAKHARTTINPVDQRRRVYAVATATEPRADYPSIASAAEAVGLRSHNSIVLAVRQGNKAAGRHWRFADVAESMQPPLKRGYGRAIIIDGTRYENIGAATASFKTYRKAIDLMLRDGRARYADGLPGTRTWRKAG